MVSIDHCALMVLAANSSRLARQFGTQSKNFTEPIPAFFGASTESGQCRTPLRLLVLVKLWTPNRPRTVEQLDWSQDKSKASFLVQLTLAKCNSIDIQVDQESPIPSAFELSNVMAREVRKFVVSFVPVVKIQLPAQ